MKQQFYLLTIAEVCSLLRIGKNTAYDLIHSGELKSIRIRNQHRIPRVYVQEYIEKNTKGKLEDVNICPDKLEGGLS